MDEKEERKKVRTKRVLSACLAMCDANLTSSFLSPPSIYLLAITISHNTFKSYLLVTNISKKNNVGNMVRSAVAFGFDAVIVVGLERMNMFGSKVRYMCVQACNIYSICMMLYMCLHVYTVHICICMLCIRVLHIDVLARACKHSYIPEKVHIPASILAVSLMHKVYM